MSQQGNQTVILQTIDGIEVIRGFGKLSIDPHETKKVAAVAIQSTDEFIAVKAKQDARDESARKAGEENAKLKTAQKSKNKSDENKYWKSREAYRNIMASEEQEIKALLPALKKKRQEVMQSEAVYFEPKLGEYAKTDAEIQTLRDVIASVQGSGYVDIDGNILEDNRGVIYCSNTGDKWTITKITQIGIKVPASAILYADLDADHKKAVDLQVEINSVVGLSAAQKSDMKVAADALAVAEAGNLDRSLQIQGSSADDALVQAQSWLVSRRVELDLVYGV